MSSWGVKRVEGFKRSVRSGAPLVQEVRWQLIDPQGIARDSFGKRKDCWAAAIRMNKEQVA